jgi:hypothetical protein
MKKGQLQLFAMTKTRYRRKFAPVQIVKCSMIPRSHAITPPEFCVIRVQMHLSNVKYALFTSSYETATKHCFQRSSIIDIKLRLLLISNGNQGLQTIKLAPLTSSMTKNRCNVSQRRTLVRRRTTTDFGRPLCSLSYGHGNRWSGIDTTKRVTVASIDDTYQDDDSDPIPGFLILDSILGTKTKERENRKSK